MLFNSVQFIVFFAVVFCCYFFCSYVIKKNIVTQLVLLSFSLFFYACWKVEYLALILISVLITYASGIFMESKREHKGLILFLSLFFNLAILFFFKYYNFVTGAANGLISKAGGTAFIPELNVLLPVGISFYTFQALGYSIDVYNGKVKAERNLITYALFVTFFPQLVAGPIERTGNLLPQFKVDNKFDYDRVTGGLKLCAWGFFQKIVVADRLAVYVNSIYSNLETATGCSVAFAIFLFSFQILCDFAGYSNIAIGVAQVLGFKLMKNFKRPFFSKSVPELWSRWHISLSTWLKDYIYFPLGGSRVPTWRKYFNLTVTFFLSGVWHGAAWHFIAWGLMYSAVQIIDLMTKKGRANLLVKTNLAVLDASEKSGIRVCRKWQICQILITFLFFALSTVFFRADNMGQAGKVYLKLVHVPVEIAGFISNLGNGSLVESVRSLFLLNEDVSGFGFKHAFGSILLISMLLAVDIMTRRIDGIELIKKQNVIVRWCCYYFIVSLIIFFSVQGKTQFVYFQF